MENNNKQTNWYYEKDGKQVGPVLEDEIKSELEKGNLSYKNMVWKNHVSNRAKLINSELKHLLKDTCSLPVNNIFVIIILLLPIPLIIIDVMKLGGWYVPFLNMILPYKMYSEQTVVYVECKRILMNRDCFLIVFILLVITQLIMAFYDLMQIKRKKYDVSKMWRWIWFAPVYLFYRVKCLGTGKVYLKIYYGLIIVSCVLFCVRLSTIGRIDTPDVNDSNIEKMLIKNVKRELKLYRFQNGSSVKLGTIRTISVDNNGELLVQAEVDVDIAGSRRTIFFNAEYKVGYTSQGQLYIKHVKLNTRKQIKGN